VAKPEVALPAEQAAHLAGHVAVVDAKPLGWSLPADGASTALALEHGIVLLERNPILCPQEAAPAPGALGMAELCPIGRIPLGLAPLPLDARPVFGELPRPVVRIGRPSMPAPRIDLVLVKRAPGAKADNMLLSGFRVSRMSLLRRWSTGGHGAIGTGVGWWMARGAMAARNRLDAGRAAASGARPIAAALAGE
jgi:hypothetical protein